jgi:hypothetical protein
VTSSSPGGVFAAITGGSICSESGGGGEEQEPSGGLGSSSAGVLQRTDRMKRDAGMLLPHPRPARRIASRAGT